jgi:hypothetical protein
VIGKGLFVIPPQINLTIITLVVTIGPALFQMSYNNPNFLKNQLEHNIDLSSNFIGINISFSILTFLSVVFLLLAAGTEPGIIPRHIDVLMESIPPAYREMAEKQENRRRF